MNPTDSLSTLAAAVSAPAYVRHSRLLDWVREVAALAKPDRIVWCDGSDEEYDRLCGEMVASGTMMKLNPAKRPNSFLGGVRSDRRRAGRGPHVHLQRERGRRRSDQQLGRPGGDAGDAPGAVRRLHARPHDVRDPVQHGPARLPYRAHRRRAVRLAVRRRQHEAHDAHGARGARRARRRRRVRALRALGRHAARDRARRTCRGRATRTSKYIVHFPEAREIWSYGSGYGGNALLGKKCLALRIASIMARDQGWLAEHMLILGRHRRRPARRPTSRRRSRAPAARPISRC